MNHKEFVAAIELADYYDNLLKKHKKEISKYKTEINKLKREITESIPYINTFSYWFSNTKGICPKCKKYIIIDGYVCFGCGFDSSISK
jgi:hypothetical protein